MAFSVEPKESPKEKINEINRLDLELLAVGKQTGLSFAEINELRVCDLLDYAGAYAGSKKDTPYKATQADIDKFFA